MLKRLYVDNYRCLVNFECHFAPTQLILGPNGGGKTTLFDILALLRDFCCGGIPVELGFVGYTRTRWQDIPQQTFELDVSGNGGDYTLRLIVDSWGTPARPRVVKEEVYFSGKPIFRFTEGEVHLFNDKHEDKVQYPFDWFRSALATITARPDNAKLSWFKQWLGNVWIISPDPRQMSPLAEKEEAAPTSNLSNFAAWYRHVRLESDNDQDLLEDLREAIPGFESMALKDAGMGNRVLMSTFSMDGNLDRASPNYTLSLHELSDGQRVLFGLYTVLHFALRRDAMLCFDEPDNFVALQEIEPWLEKILDQVDDDETGSQVLFVSHHPELLNRLAYRGGLLLDRPEGRHTRVQPFNDPAETGLTPAELISRGWDHE